MTTLTKVRGRKVARPTGRAAFEIKLMEDGDLRTKLATAREAAQFLKEEEGKVIAMRRELHRTIRDLVRKHGAPKAFIARQVGLSPQRINSILKEGR